MDMRYQSSQRYGLIEKMSNQTPIRVALVDDDDLLRSSLRILIDGSNGFRCVDEYHDLEAALASRTDDAVDLWLLDVDLPGMKGPEGVRALLEQTPNAEVVMFTVYADDEKVFSSLCNGASGYLLKDTPPDQLLRALRDAATGGAPMSSQIARKVIRQFQKVAPRASHSHSLTRQEVKLLGLLAEGYSYQRAADRLFVSINTVRSHIRNIYDKLHVHSRSQAVHKAISDGIL